MLTRSMIIKLAIVASVIIVLVVLSLGNEAEKELIQNHETNMVSPEQPKKSITDAKTRIINNKIKNTTMMTAPQQQHQTTKPTSTQTHHQNSNRRKTVAVCFFGLVKNIKPDQMQRYVKHLYKKLWDAGYSTVTLMHTFKMDHYVNSRTGENASPSMIINQTASLDLLRSNVVVKNDHDGDSSGEQSFILNVSNPQEADDYFGSVDRYFKFGDPWPENARVSMTSYLRQQYSLLRLSEMLEEEQKKFRVTNVAGEVVREKFVGAVFVRPDMFFFDDIDIPLFDFTIKKNNRIALPTWFMYWNTGFNDRFAFGSVEAMIIYSRRGKHLFEYSQTKSPHAEQYLRDYLCSRQFEVHFTRTRIARMRLHGIHAPDGEHGLNYLIRANEERWKDPRQMNSKIEYRGCPRRVWKTFGVDA